MVFYIISFTADRINTNLCGSLETACLSLQVEYFLSECEGNHACLIQVVRECVKPGIEENR